MYTTTTSSSKQQSNEQVYYAKLVNVNQQERPQRGHRGNNSLQRRQCIRNASQLVYNPSRLSSNYLNDKLAEYLNEADYEALMNFDSVLDKAVVPTVDSSSTSSSASSVKTECLNYSNEEEEYQKYYELEKFHSSLKKSSQSVSKMETTNKPSSNFGHCLINGKRIDSTSVGSFSTSSACSLSSQSSVANSSSSSAAASPLLSSNFLAEANTIYSTNFKVRVSSKPTPAVPSTQPPSLIQNSTPTWLHRSQTAEGGDYEEFPCVYGNLADAVTQRPVNKREVLVLKKSNAASTSRLLSVKQQVPPQPPSRVFYDSTLLTPLKVNGSQLKEPPLVADSYRSNSSTHHSSKSASTSYLLSKISSIASLTKSGQSPPLVSSNTASNPLATLANRTNKFFNRKSLSGQQQDGPNLMVSCSSSSISSPTTASSTSSPLAATSIEIGTSSSSSSSYSVASASRRPFKKRSQSSHLNCKQVWRFDADADVWSLVDPKPLDTTSSLLTSTLRLGKRKSSVNQNRFGDEATTSECMRLRLTQVEVKYLTQIELKYLKQICFNKFKAVLEVLHAELMASDGTTKRRKQSFGGASGGSGGSTSGGSIQLNAIPKDESLKTSKTKNIAIRSKSVDFKFFDELRENYLFKKGPQPNQLVFGQSLYKCILNDLQQGVGRPAKWRQQSNVLIASKFDLTGQAAKTTVEDLVGKRNSVLFEALDLKAGGQQRVSRLGANTRQVSPSPQKQPDVNSNQNLSIRCEGLVPNIVKSCCRHIAEHGLHLVGIFRIDSSKKRIKEVPHLIIINVDIYWTAF